MARILDLMKRTTAATLLLGFVALFGAQLSGVHAHLSSDGFHGAVQSTHDDDHHHDHGGDHDGDVDVQVVDYGIGTSKVMFVPFAVALTLFLLAFSRGQLRFDRKAQIPISRRLHWRPPLRAPPR
jgi:hypothetical protein